MDQLYLSYNHLLDQLRMEDYFVQHALTQELHVDQIFINVFIIMAQQEVEFIVSNKML